MKKYDDIVATANELLSAIKNKDKEQMAAKMDELEHKYKYDFGDSLNNYETIYAYFFIKYVSVEFFHFNNFYNNIHSTWEEVHPRYEGFSKSKLYSSEEKEEIHRILML